MRAGDVLLVHAAAGGVGSMVVQLARVRGATVIGTAGPANHDYLRDLGAIPVEYGPGLADRVREVAPQVDAALDLVGGEAVAVSVELVADRARIGTTVDAGAVEKYGITRVGGRSTAALAQAVELAGRGAVATSVAAILPLADAAEAHRLVETGHTRGKLALRP